MNTVYQFFFLIFPYIALTVFVVGHTYRYLTDTTKWNARSSQLLEPGGRFPGRTVFHIGILGTLAGHVGGMLVPQRVYDMLGIKADMHNLAAHWGGLVLGAAAFGGIAYLLVRRFRRPRLRATTSVNDVITIGGLVFVTGAGLYNVVFGEFPVLYTIAPWIRGILVFHPDISLIAGAPLGFKVHIVAALLLLAFSPFSRLVHIWSAPVAYLIRRPVVFRRHVKMEG